MSYLYSMKIKIEEEKWFGIDFFMTVVMAGVEAVIYYFLFHFFFLGNEKINSQEIILYYIVVNIISISYRPAHFVAWNHMEDITKGNISLALVKPINYKMQKYSESIAVFLLNIGINFFFVFMASFILKVKLDFFNILEWILSVINGFTILYLIQAIIGSMSVWFWDIFKLRNVFMTLLMIFGGQVIPSNLLYANLKKIVYYTPIPYVYDVPVNILLGNIKAYYIFVQIIWILGLSIIYSVLMDKFVIHNIEMGG